MGEIINFNCSNGVEKVRTENDLISLTEDMLLDVRSISNKNVLSVPIAELSTLGAGISSLIPALNTATQVPTLNTEGLFQLANAGVGDTLKVAKNGNFWGSFKTADGKSKFVQLQEVGSVSSTTKTVMPINPATMMMAVALFSIEQQLDNIEEAQKRILSFLELEKEAEIEADVETLMSIINKYKLNWDNEYFVNGNHKLVLDIQRTARTNMNFYQKEVRDTLSSKKLVVVQPNVESTFNDLEKKFEYYRLSLYVFSMASFLEIMLSGNFKEEHITGVEEEIRALSNTYRELFDECSAYIEKLSSSALDTNMMKGLGIASKAVGNFIGVIPGINKVPVDEFLQDSGSKLQCNAIEIEKKSVGVFAALSNPGTGVFMDKMEKMIQIFNHTEQICFDHDNIYLLSDAAI